MACTHRFLSAFARHFDPAPDEDPNHPVARPSLVYDAATETYTVRGGGAGFSGVFDQFHFTHKTLWRDGSITVRVDSLEDRHRLTKAGVMVRSSLDGAARHACAWVTPSGTANFQYRTADDGLVETAADGGIGGTLPRWLRVTREGNMVHGEYSNDGTTWRPIKGTRSDESGSATIEMGDIAYVGLVVVSRADPFVPVTAEISHVTVTGTATPSGPFSQLADIGFQPRTSRDR